ncbi:MAG TPA: hypothetical protein VFZ49_04320 [Pyrinomonadaceae bacterium]
MRSFILFGFLAAVVGFGSFNIAAQGTAIKAEIPFEFTVGKKTLPAGEYLVVLPMTGGANFVTFKSLDGNSSGFVMTNWVSSKKAEVASGLTFVKSGDRHVLYQVFDGREIGHEVVSSKKLAGSELARRTVVVKPSRS